MYVDLGLKTNKEIKERITIFNYRNKESLTTFKRMTSESTKLSNCFKTNELLSVQTQKWKRALNCLIRKCFSKVRLRKRIINPTKISHMMKERQKAIEDNDVQNLQYLEDEIKKTEAQANMDNNSKLTN